MVKKNWSRLLILACFLSIGLHLSAQDCDLTGWRLFIDPGHGGSDPGAVGPTGLQEKFATLDTGLRLRDYLQSFGATVGMSRTTDVFVPLTTRATQANQFGADRFVSVHYNSFSNPSVNGTEVYVVPNPSATTRDLGQRLLDWIVGYLGLPNRGLKFANFTVLVRTSMSAALSESSFISNPQEEQRLRDPNYRDTVAAGHNDGLCDHLGSFFGTIPDGNDWDGMDPPDQTVSGTLIRPDSEGRLRVVHVIEGKRKFLAPKFSPDGNLIAFSEFGYRGIFVADVSNPKPEPLTLDRGAGFKFSWSPDSRQIAFVSRGRDGYTVKLVDVRTKETASIVSNLNRAVHPEFQPNGDLLIIPEDPENDSPYRFNFSNAFGSPSAIAYVSSKDDQVWIEANGAKTQLTQGEDVLYTDLKLSPRKDKLLLNRNSQQGSSMIVLDIHTKQKHDLSTLGVGRQGDYNIGYEGTWSPDGESVLFSLTKDDGHVHVGSDLYFIPGGRTPVRLTNDGAVKLSPDWSTRNQIAYEDDSGRIIMAEFVN